MICSVQEQDAWAIHGPKLGGEMLYSSPEEALLELVLHAEYWPEDVGFWLSLARKGGDEWPALGHVWDGCKRPSFHSIGVLRRIPDIDYSMIDFWFLLRFLEALEECNYRYVHVPCKGETRDASILSGRLLDVPQAYHVRRKRSWAKEFLLIRSPGVLNWAGVTPINKPSPERRGWYVRTGHRSGGILS